MVRLDGTSELGRLEGGPLADQYSVLTTDVGVAAGNAVEPSVYVR